MTTEKKDVVDATENAVSLVDARDMICQWRTVRGGEGSTMQPDCFFIPLPDIQNIIALAMKNGGTGVRAYLAVETGAPQLKLLMVACQHGETDFVEPIAGTPLYTIYDLIKPCPPLCTDLRSPLIDFKCQN